MMRALQVYIHQGKEKKMKEQESKEKQKIIKIKQRRIRTAQKGGSAVGFPLNATSKLPLIFLFPPLYFPLLISLVMCHVIPTTTVQLNLLENVNAYHWPSKLLFFIGLTQLALYKYL